MIGAFVGGGVYKEELDFRTGTGCAAFTVLKSNSSL